MKVFLCLHHFLPAVVGGTEVYTLNLAKQLQNQGWQVVVVVPNFDENSNKEYTIDGVRVIMFVEESLEDRLMIMGKKKPEGLTEFLKIVGQENPDLIHFHELAPGRGFNHFHVEAVFKLKLPIILTFHLSFYTCFKGSLVFRNEVKCDGVIDIAKCTNCIFHEKGLGSLQENLLRLSSLALFRVGIDTTGLNSTLGTALGFPYVVARRRDELLHLIKMANKLIVLADWYKQVLIRNNIPAEKLVGLPQTSTATMASREIQPLPVSIPLKLVYVGRISKQKGVHLLISAIQSLPAKSILLDIYGPEPEAEYVAATKRSSQSNLNIRWKGTLSSTDLIRTLSQYHILCLPSDFEMSPLIIQEAFAAGLPVLASDVEGVKEQIEDGVNGWIFKFRNSDDLAAKLSMLLSNPGLIEEARQNLPSVQDFSVIANQHIDIYNSVLQEV